MAIGYSSALDRSDVNFHTATVTMIADVRIESHSSDNPVRKPGEHAQRNDADAVRQLKEAAKAVLEQDGADQEQQWSADRAQAPS